MTFATEKLEWCGYQLVKKKFNFEDTFTSIHRMYERDRQMDSV